MRLQPSVLSPPSSALRPLRPLPSALRPPSSALRPPPSVLSTFYLTPLHNSLFRFSLCVPCVSARDPVFIFCRCAPSALRPPPSVLRPPSSVVLTSSPPPVTNHSNRNCHFKQYEKNESDRISGVERVLKALIKSLQKKNLTPSNPGILFHK